MKKLLMLTLFLMVMSITSCTTEKVEFEKSVWWTWHWQNVADTTLYISSGQKPIGE